MAVYLDHNATTPLAPEALEAMLPLLRAEYGNPSSVHGLGASARNRLDEARERVAAFLGCRPAEVIFTSGATEANNLAILGTARARRDRRRIVTTAVEHPSVLGPCAVLEHEGREVVRVPVDGEGRLDVAGAREALTEGTALLSIMLANNETGAIHPVAEIARIARERGIPVHCDAVQAAGKIPLPIREGLVDLLSISGHKIHGPKGVGALFVRRGFRLDPILFGGHQEKGRRPGTENPAGAAGLAAACDLAERTPPAAWERVAGLRDGLEAGLLDRIPRSRANGARSPRVPNTTNLSFEGVEGEAVLLLLSEAGICASSGSACSSGSLEPSHVLLAMGLPERLARGSIRLSLGRNTTGAEIEEALAEIPRAVERLRAIAPVVD